MSENTEGPHERIVGRLREYADQHDASGPYDPDIASNAADLRAAADELDRLRAENEALREALAGAVNVLDLLRAYGAAKYDYASSRAGTLVHVARTIDAATALLTPNAPFSGERSESAGTGS